MTSIPGEQELRAVLQDGPLAEIVARLPNHETCESGLCVDHDAVAGIRMEGRVRLSVLRVFSKSGDRKHLVGQVQVMAHTAAKHEWDIAYYVHDVHIPFPTQVADHASWWNAVMQRHFHATGGQN